MRKKILVYNDGFVENTDYFPKGVSHDNENERNCRCNRRRTCPRMRKCGYWGPIFVIVDEERSILVKIKSRSVTALTRNRAKGTLVQGTSLSGVPH